MTEQTRNTSDAARERSEADKAFDDSMISLMAWLEGALAKGFLSSEEVNSHLTAKAISTRFLRFCRYHASKLWRSLGANS